MSSIKEALEKYWQALLVLVVVTGAVFEQMQHVAIVAGNRFVFQTFADKYVSYIPIQTNFTGGLETLCLLVLPVVSIVIFKNFPKPVRLPLALGVGAAFGVLAVPGQMLATGIVVSLATAYYFGVSRGIDAALLFGIASGVGVWVNYAGIVPPFAIIGTVMVVQAICALPVVLIALFRMVLRGEAQNWLRPAE